MADIERYLALLTSQHGGKQLLVAWLTALLTKLDDVTASASALTAAFDLDAAVGLQLDILGQILGVGRTVSFQPSGGAGPVLDDATYRLVLRARIARNQWDGTLGAIQELWANLFGAVPAYLILVDNQDMTMTAVVIGLADPIQQDLVTNGYVVPKPAGVGLNVATPANKLFAYGVDSSAFGGYGVGYWIQYSTI